MSGNKTFLVGWVYSSVWSPWASWILMGPCLVWLSSGFGAGSTPLHHLHLRDRLLSYYHFCFGSHVYAADIQATYTVLLLVGPTSAAVLVTSKALRVLETWMWTNGLRLRSFKNPIDLDEIAADFLY